MIVSSSLDKLTETLHAPTQPSVLGPAVSSTGQETRTQADAPQEDEAPRQGGQ